MQRTFLTIFLFPFLVFGYCPEQELGPLFRAVQMQNVFADSKTFVDCNPKCSPQAILEIYEQECPQNLAAFVNTYFDMPEVCSQPL